MPDITNALFDALIASETAPITRVTDIDLDFPTVANSGFPVKCQTTVGSIEFFISYDELGITAQWQTIVSVADGIDSQIDRIDAILQSTTAAIGGFTKPYSPAEWESVIDALKTLPDMLPIMGN